MNYVLIGHGKMGRAVELAAAARGHACVAIVDRVGRGRRVVRDLGGVRWRDLTMAFEFTEPASAKGHVIAALEHGVPVVCGTTGWDASDPAVRKAARISAVGAVIAANFSIGVNLFYAIVDEAARRYLATDDYDPWVAEWHHRGKADAPSGTARRLAGIVSAATSRGTSVASVRAGHEPGRHVVGFDGCHDAVTLEHRSRGREGFAQGAVLAAEWLVGRRGLHDFSEVLNDRVRARAGRGGRR